MKTITVHSFKGGTGKTTLALCLAKHFSRSHRVAVSDLDLTGTGLHYTLELKPKGDRAFFESYLRSDTRESYPIEDLLTPYEDDDAAFTVILNRMGGRDKPWLQSVLGRSKEMPFLSNAWNELVAALEARDLFDYLIVDCHPGLTFLSANLLQDPRTCKLLVTTWSRPRAWGALLELRDLLPVDVKVGETGFMFAVNMSPAGTDEERWLRMVEKDKIVATGGALINRLAIPPGHIQTVNRDPKLETLFDLGNDGLLPRLDDLGCAEQLRHLAGRIDRILEREVVRDGGV